MRIAYISTIRSAPWGGSEELWFQSAKKALAEGHQIGVFVYEWPELPPALKYLQEQGAVIYSRQRSPSLGKRLLGRLARKAGAEHPVRLNPYRDLLRFAPDRVVITDGATWYSSDDEWLRDLLLRHYEGKYLIISQGNSPYHFPGNRGQAIGLFNKARHIVFVSENNRQQAVHQLVHPIPHSSVIQNPVNVKTLEPAPLPDPTHGTIHLAMVGRLFVADKGQDIVIAMMAEPYWKEANVQVHIYGRGSDQDYLQQLIGWYGVQDRVIIEGHTPVESIWQRSHALLMPSIVEGTPLTLLEAMVKGRVCIVTRVGGNDEWIEDGKNGYLAAAPTQELFSRTMRQAMEERDKWPQIARQAHTDAMARLDRHPGDTLLQRILS